MTIGIVEQFQAQAKLMVIGMVVAFECGAAKAALFSFGGPAHSLDYQRQPDVHCRIDGGKR